MNARKLGLLLIGFILALTILGWFYTPYDPNATFVLEKFTPPGRDHLFGTDHFGRDVLSRILPEGVYRF